MGTPGLGPVARAVSRSLGIRCEVGLLEVCRGKVVAIDGYGLLHKAASNTRCAI